jgi:hypothetical protein
MHLEGWFVGRKVKIRRGKPVPGGGEEIGDITLSSPGTAAQECGAISRRQERKRRR